MQEQINGVSDSKRSGLSKVGIVYFGNDWYAENRTSSHHIARGMAGEVTMLYVDSPGMRQPSASGRDLGRIWRKLSQTLRGAKYVDPGLWHCTVPQLPWNRLPGVGWFNRMFGAWAVRRAMRRAGIESPILWFVVPHPAFMIDHIDCKLIVYYCIDDYSLHPGVDVELIRSRDLLLTRRADHVFVAPSALVDAKKAINPATTFSPHGVDVELFGRAQLAQTQVPAQAARLEGPVIGYFGLIAGWTDLELLEWLARQRPQWKFLLVGHAKVDVSRLAACANVLMVGPQPYEALPGWAKAFDAAIIPYRIDSMVQKGNPLKLREYLATGKPIVSVPTPEIERFRDFIHIAEGREAFLAGIESALAFDTAALKAARIKLVSAMSWESRVEQTLDRVAGLLEVRRGSGQGA